MGWNQKHLYYICLFLPKQPFSLESASITNLAKGQMPHVEAISTIPADICTAAHFSLMMQSQGRSKFSHSLSMSPALKICTPHLRGACRELFSSGMHVQFVSSWLKHLLSKQLYMHKIFAQHYHALVNFLSHCVSKQAPSLHTRPLPFPSSR